jgi:hypothetical protein
MEATITKLTVNPEEAEEIREATQELATVEKPELTREESFRRTVAVVLNDPHRSGPKHIVADLPVLIERLNSYFNPFPNPPTFTGLALHLGYACRKSLFDMLERGNQLSLPIQKAMAIIELYHEGRLDRAQCAGTIFWLKQIGWTDRVDMTTDGEAITPQTVSFLNVPRPEPPNEIATEQQGQKALPEGCPQGDDTEPAIL